MNLGKHILLIAVLALNAAFAWAQAGTSDSAPDSRLRPGATSDCMVMPDKSEASVPPGSNVQGSGDEHGDSQHDDSADRQPTLIGPGTTSTDGQARKPRLRV